MTTVAPNEAVENEPEGTENKGPRKRKDLSHVAPHADTYGHVPHPGLEVDENGDPTVKLTAVPGTEGGHEEVWHRSKHQTLKTDDFETEALYFRWKAFEHRVRADEFDQKAEESTKLGSSKDRKQAKQLLTAKNKLEALTAKLKAEGFDVDEILGAGAGDSEE